MFNREPAVIVSTLGSVIALGVGFGLKVSPEQVGLTLAATSSVLGLVTRSLVTPKSKAPVAP